MISVSIYIFFLGDMLVYIFVNHVLHWSTSYRGCKCLGEEWEKLCRGLFTHQSDTLKLSASCLTKLNEQLHLCLFMFSTPCYNIPVFERRLCSANEVVCSRLFSPAFSFPLSDMKVIIVMAVFSSVF